MNTLFFLPLTLLVIFCQGAPIVTPPINLSITSFGDQNKAWFLLKWDAAKSTDDKDPILGYQVKVWALDKVSKIIYANKDGKMEKKQVEEIPDMQLNEDPKGEVTVIDVPANTTEAIFNGVKVEVTYEIGVQAYTANEVTPFSSKMRMKLNAN